MPKPGLVVGSKLCSKCKASKPLREFAPDRRKRTGRASACHQCDSARRVERYRNEPAFRAAALQWGAAYRKTERGSLVTSRAELRVQLRGAVKPATKARLRQRIAELGGRIAELRAGRGQVRDVA